ncbi:MAG: ATP-dependent DNA helicase RecQ [Labilithrix sp.]|nr:ATP-dependent DNA helicase RecQ [Labilithrix sp.]
MTAARCYEGFVLPMSFEQELRSRFGLDAFHPWQREAVDAVLGEPGRALVVAPTGGGKSLTYQFPAAILEGTTLVISPLVALMEDQVRSLTARGVAATYLASTLDRADRDARESAMLRGEFKLVYVAPERLGSDVFVRLLSRCRISLVAIDEAHCIAQWGHDFRPDYLRIGALLERLSPPRVLACTATATPAVRREIKERLGLGTPEAPCREVLRGFARPNLHLAAQTVDGKKEARAALLEGLEAALGARGRGQPASGGAIVYAATRKSTEDVADLLTDRGWRAAAYHAGMSGEARTRVADRFASRAIDVVVATNAFGMGIDRPDIRAVIHVQPPASIEAYYQEVGRAGRDGREASGLLLCSGADISLRRRLTELGSDGAAADPALAARAWGLFRELLRYLDARTCRHDFVLRYFGDEQETLGGCGHCDVCLALDGASPEEVDGAASARDEETTLFVKKALSAVARAQRRAGLVAIADMLRGVDSEKTRKFGFTSLTTFGLMRERSSDWIMALLRALLAAGWIDLTPTEHPVPFLTRAGADVMKGAAPARIILPPDAAPKERRSRARSRASASREPISLDAATQPVFEKLRAHRAEVARSRGVPPYVVALDRTLVEMARARPETTDQLLMLHGMGPARAEQYGAGFLRVIADA